MKTHALERQGGGKKKAKCVVLARELSRGGASNDAIFLLAKDPLLIINTYLNTLDHKKT